MGDITINSDLVALSEVITLYSITLLADRTNGRAIGTVFRPSSVVVCL